MPGRAEWNKLTAEQKFDQLYDQALLTHEQLGALSRGLQQLAREVGDAVSALEEKVKS